MLQSVEPSPDKVQIQTSGAGNKSDRSTIVTIIRSIFQVALMVGVIAGSFVMMNRLIAAKPERKARPQFDVVLPIEATIVRLGDQRPTVSLFGEIAAARSIELRPSVSGEVISVNPQTRSGSKVEAGAELFAVDRFTFETALAEAKANLAQTDATIAESNARLAAETEQLEFAQTQLQLAKDDLTRAERLRGKGTITQKQVDDRFLLVSQREQAVQLRRDNIAIEAPRAAQQTAIRERQALGLTRAERDLENTIVRAPFSGVVRTSTVEVGRIVSANDIAVSMYDDSALDVRFTLTNAQYGRIAADNDPLVGRSVDIKWSVGGSDYAYKAVVSRIGADIASERGGIDVYATLASNTQTDVQLRPGAFVEIALPDRLYANAARVPETAIFNSDTAYLIVDGALQSRPIRLVAFDGGDAIVAAGLNDGDTILSTRIAEIEEGLKVRVVDANGVDAPGQAPQASSGKGTGAGAGGRPSPELIAKAKEMSGLTDGQWDALSREERRPYIDNARAARGQTK